MAKSFLPLGDLISNGWHEFLAHWNQTTRMTLWLLVIPLIQLLVALGLPASALTEGSWALNLLSILQLFVTFWVITRVVKWYLAESHGDKTHLHDGRSALEALPGLALIALLKGLAVAGGLLLFVIPGLWLSVLLDFAYLAYLEDGKRGLVALQHSANLVKGRWFPVFGRIIVYTLLFLLLALGLQLVLATIVRAISGYDLSSVDWSLVLTDPAMAKYVLTTNATYAAVAAVAQAMVIPLIFAWQIRLYKDLKGTR